MRSVTLRKVAVQAVQIGDFIAVKPHCDCEKVVRGPETALNGDGVSVVSIWVENAQYPIKSQESSFVFRLESVT